MKNYLSNNYPKQFNFLKKIYHMLNINLVENYIAYYFKKFIFKDKVYSTSIEKVRSAWQNELKTVKNEEITTWRTGLSASEKNPIKKILNVKSNEHKCIIDIGSYDGFFVPDYFMFEQIICSDVFDESGVLIKQKYGHHKNLSFVKINGNDISKIKDLSVDFVFCIDSLSRLPRIVIENYFKDLNRIIRRGGEIFIHLPKNNIENKRSGFTIVPKKTIQNILKKHFKEIIFRDDLDKMGYFVSAYLSENL